MQTVLSTNLAMPRFDADAYIRSGLDYMILSIDGATQPVYERFRKKGKIEIVFHNIQKLVEARLRSGKRTPVLCWQYLAFDHNAHEISAAIDIARCLGLDTFRIASPFDVAWDEPGVQPAMIEPSILEFNEDSEQRLAENWNPFPGEIAAKTIAREFETGWGERAVREPHRDYTGTERSQHTCHWLYKKTVMDTTVIFFPFCAAHGP